MNRWTLPLVWCVALLWSSDAMAGPSISLSTSTKQARKGESFHLYVKLTASDDVTDLRITPSLPTGFKVIDTGEVPGSLTSGSSATVDLTIMPPGFSLAPTAGSDTREDKILIVNVSYVSQVNGQPKPGRQTAEQKLSFSIAGWQFFLIGVFSVAIGSVVKISLSHRTSSIRKFSGALNTQWLSLATSILLGFAVLLLLSASEIPAKGWYDTAALGFGLAFLTDEQLLKKFAGQAS
jgi:hypothetical protein